MWCLANFVAKLMCLVFLSLLFYFSTNDYYFINGSWRDLSLLGWGFMLIVWGKAIYSYIKYRKPEMLFFAVQFVIVVFVFDCWRLNIYAQNTEVRLLFFSLMAADIGALIIGLGYRLWGVVSWCLAGIIVSFAGGVLIYPLILPIKTVLYGSGAVFLISLFWGDSNKLRRKIILGLYLFVLSLIGGKQWLETPGIKFFEKGVDTVSEDIKVSVVVPVYNAEDKIERCLDSLRRQNLKEIEVILVNDGSTDGSLEILNKYAAFDKRFRVISQENQFVSVARNKGMAAAKGEYIGFVDSDDFVSENYYEELYRVAKKFDADLATANVMKVEDAGTAREKIVKLDLVWYINESLVNVWEKDRLSSRVFVWDKIYRKAFLEKYHISGTVFRSKFEDYYFTFQALMYGKKMAVASQALYYYMRYPDTVSVLSVANTSVNDKSLDLAMDMEKLILNADIDEEWRKIWLEIFAKQRDFSLGRIYMFLKEDDKSVWKEKYETAFPQAKFDFDEFVEEQYNKKKINDKIMTF